MAADASQELGKRSLVRRALGNGLGRFAVAFLLIVPGMWVLDYALPPSMTNKIYGALRALAVLPLVSLVASVFVAPVAFTLLGSSKERGAIAGWCGLIAALAAASQLPLLAVHHFGWSVDGPRQVDLELWLPSVALVIACSLLFLALKPLCLSGKRVLGVQRLCYAATIATVLFATFLLGRTLRARAIDRIADNAVPLIEAIERFTSENYRHPRRLSELVPTYLAAIPPTGHGRYPEFRYDTVRPSVGSRETWMLYVPTSDWLEFTDFEYRPSGDYPEDECEVRGAWAVRHEEGN